jgi:hypothetical protein
MMEGLGVDRLLWARSSSLGAQPIGQKEFGKKKSAAARPKAG